MADDEKGLNSPEIQIDQSGDEDVKDHGDSPKTGEGGMGSDVTSDTAHKTWGSRLSYILTLVGYAVGFGNIWRFPYMMRENGGLVFLIPYFAMLMLIGVPIFFLELAVGQRRRKGIVYCWHEISPAFGGLGISCAWICYMVGLYYTTLLAYCISYFIDSFKSPLPWTNCTTVSEEASFQKECENEVLGRSTKYYFYRETLSASPGIHESGQFNGPLAGSLLIAWAANWAILSMDATVSSAAVAQVTAIFPYIVLAIFFVANWVHEPAKAWRGTLRFLRPRWSYLYQPSVWMKAGSQIFYSLGLGSCLPVFASHNPARYDCFKDSTTVSLINAFSSLFAAFVVFPMMGTLGHKKYDECVSSLKKVYPQLQLWKENDDNYFDIYYASRANLVVEVNASNPVIFRYGFGEWSDDGEGQEFKKGTSEFMNYGKALGYKYEEITKPPQCDSYCTNFTKLEDVLLNCSITAEATASGSGTGFVFVGFTQAVLGMPGSNFWSVIFFLMFFMLGIDSGYGTIEGSVAALEELYHLKRWAAAAIVCGSLTVLGTTLFSFGWGIYILDLIDQWTANWTILLIALAECIAVAYNYSLAQIAYDVHLMTGRKPSMFILLCWKYMTPAILLILLGSSIVEYILLSEDGGLLYETFDPKVEDNTGGLVEKPYPWYTLFVGVLLMIFCILWLPLQAFLRKTKYSLLKDEPPSDFPEEELREERNINVENEADQFTLTEQKIMGKTSLTSLQKYREKRKNSARRNSLESKKSGISL